MRATLKNERVDSSLTARNIRAILNHCELGRSDKPNLLQNAYMLCQEIIEDMAIHGVPREFFADVLKDLQLSIPLIHHVTYKNDQAIAVWEAEANTGAVLRII